MKNIRTEFTLVKSLLITKDMNQAKEDTAMLNQMLLDQHKIEALTLISNGTNELFILDGKERINDLIYAWTHFTQLKEFQQKVIDSCRKEERLTVCLWTSPDGQESVTIVLEGVSKQLDWLSLLNNMNVSFNKDISEKHKKFLIKESDTASRMGKFLITESYSASRMGIIVITGGKKKAVRMNQMHVGVSYDRFNRKDRNKLLKQVRKGKDIHLKNFIPTDLRKVRSESFLDIEFKNLALIKLIQGIFKRGNPQIQFDNSGKVREKICWNSNCQESETKLLKCTG